jgi:hypothetical protein
MLVEYAGEISVDEFEKLLSTVKFAAVELRYRPCVGDVSLLGHNNAFSVALSAKQSHSVNIEQRFFELWRDGVQSEIYDLLKTGQIKIPAGPTTQKNKKFFFDSLVSQSYASASANCKYTLSLGGEGLYALCFAYAAHKYDLLK